MIAVKSYRIERDHDGFWHLNIILVSMNGVLVIRENEV